MGKFFGLRGDWLNYAIGIIAGCDFLLFGYDQGVMGGILTMHQFLEDFPEINPNGAPKFSAEAARRSTNQGISVAAYNLGCFLGAVTTIFVSNPLGRKKMIMLGTSIMVVGAILQASATTLPHFIVGRIITGFGNGGNTSTIPTWQSETSRSHKRGKLVMIEGALITCGIMISYWIDLGFSFIEGSIAWRFPLAFQIVFCLFILSFIWNMPESPRWLILKNREEEALEILAALADASPDDKEVKNEFTAIKETVLEMSKGTFHDLFTMDKDRNFHRTLLAFVNQMYQQISGINLISYFAPVIFSNLGMSDFMARLLAAINGTEYFLASWPAVFLVERVGRRKLMLFGAAGQSMSMAILAGVNSRPDSTSAQAAAVAFLFVFNTFFAIGWLGMTWLYPAEITTLRTRAPANALSTSSNWIFNFLVVMITPIAFNNIGYQTYIIFAVTNAFIVPTVYFFFPETAYRSLEEMDAIFHKVHGGKGYFTVVKVAEQEPRRYGKNGELLIAYEETEEHKAHAPHPENGSGVASINDTEKAQGGTFIENSSGQ
ncbi:general substrate transporter [Annulohypoxylon maeteangense]|uniref:general substrate transporter n=1 Tax=Annulohypoxylon maeteangense TaxID=1927788 RepID=UPI0020084D80|nr:general substrate transporter [Annulohypoxylon maeteangense]KAI0881079.1 general substrate transporter [Annulohypoxylon maeteangense]